MSCPHPSFHLSKRVVVSTRMTASEAAFIKAAATLGQRTVNEWARPLLLQAARRELLAASRTPDQPERAKCTLNLDDVWSGVEGEPGAP